MARSSLGPAAVSLWTCRACRSHMKARQTGNINLVRTRFSPRSHRPLSTSTKKNEELQIQAAPEIDFGRPSGAGSSQKPARIIPASASYFTTTPNFNDSILRLQKFARQYNSLPTVSAEQAPRMFWKNLAQFRITTGEKVGVTRYAQVLQLLKRLNLIHPDLRPKILQETLEEFRRPGSANIIPAKPSFIDKYGRSIGVGKRKSSVATVSLVEGTGEVIINGKTLAQVLPRIHDRESALWPLKVTDRLDKYNAFVTAEGGGLTGQAESITLALARALIVQEPALKPALRKAGCVTRIMKRVERKKTGRVKARKRPAWVKR